MFRTIARKTRARLRLQAGFTLIELIVASALGLILTSAALAALEAGQRTQLRDTEWALIVQEGRTGLARMVGELREATTIKSASSSAITFEALAAGKEYEISYNCAEAQTGTSFDQCVRKAVVKGGTLPSTGTPVIKDVLNGTSADQPGGKEDPVFAEYSPNSTKPNVITVKVVLPSGGTLKLAAASTEKHQIVLEDDAFLRNIDLTG